MVNNIMLVIMYLGLSDCIDCGVDLLSRKWKKILTWAGWVLFISQVIYFFVK